MAISPSQLSERKRKMLLLLAKGGAEQKQAEDLLPTYAIGKQVLSPQTIRPKQDDPNKKLQRWVQAALMVVLGVKLPLHGVIDAQTRAALLRFQKTAGLATSGAVDGATLAALESAVGTPAPHRGASAPAPDAIAIPIRAAKGGATKDDDNGDKVERTAQDQAERHSFEDTGGDTKYGEADAHELRPAVIAGKAKHDPQQLVMQRFLHTEAMQAVMALAFDRQWVNDELDRTGRSGDAALFSEMLRWWERSRSVDGAPPSWMQDVTKLADQHQTEAVAKVRQAWQKDAPTGKKNQDSP
ncbi:MAG: hypothetical protein EXR77_01695 [Myxococcales bacterium]|nr:hypothetical protein [Myxococcales bacterium]